MNVSERQRFSAPDHHSDGTGSLQVVTSEPGAWYEASISLDTYLSADNQLLMTYGSALSRAAILGMQTRLFSYGQLIIPSWTDGACVSC